MTEIEPTDDQIELELINQTRCPALMLNKTKHANDPGLPGCWLGGEPTLPPEFEWPRSSDDFASCPFIFLLQIDLAQVPQIEGDFELPKVGTLFFFHDLFFPTELVSVRYYESDASACEPRKMPELPSDDAIRGRVFKDRIANANAYNRWNFNFLLFNCFFPLAEYENISLARQSEIDSLRRLTAKRWSGSGRSSSRDFSLHYLFGCPAETPPPDGNPIHLLKIDMDSDVGFHTGGLRMHFWLPREAIKTRDFRKVYLTME